MSLGTQHIAVFLSLFPPLFIFSEKYSHIWGYCWGLPTFLPDFFFFIMLWYFLSGHRCVGFDNLNFVDGAIIVIAVMISFFVSLSFHYKMEVQSSSYSEFQDGDSRELNKSESLLSVGSCACPFSPPS